jgi:rRNA maturation RNase YbeY
MELEITVLDSRYADFVSRLREILIRAGQHMGIREGLLEAYIVGNSFMEKNVLAYPALSDFPRPDLGGKPDLGELYINPEWIASHGEDFSFMVAHAFLHLLGYDHYGAADTHAMEVKEAELLAALHTPSYE